jgi:hypothetical protein
MVAEHLRVLALSEQGGQIRVVIAAQPDNAIWIYGGEDANNLSYIQFVRMWPSASTAPEPTPADVAAAVARFGRQRATDGKQRRRVRSS